MFCKDKMRRPILTDIKSLNNIAKEMSSTKSIKAIYLFGSVARGKAGPLSDIDICVMGRLNEKEKSIILGFSSDNLDISFFEDLPTYIKFRVLKEGRPLIVKDKEFINEAKIKTARNYIDFRHVINKYSREVLGCTI